MAKKIMISCRMEPILLDEITKMLPMIDGLGCTSDLIRAAVSSFLARERRKLNTEQY